MTRRQGAFIGVGVVVLVVLAVVLTLVVSGGDDHSQAGNSSTAAPTGQGSSGPVPSVSIPSLPPPPSDLKPVIRGLIDRQGEPPKKMLDYVHAYVVKVTWADLQPEPNGPIASDNVIDKAITRVRQDDYRKLGMALKLRVTSGVNAPEWVKALGGAPIVYKNNQEGGSIAGGTLGRFWSAASQQAYTQLQRKLAAKYDGVPEIRELTMSGCTTLFDEPFVRQPGESSNSANLKAAGYTEAADKSCIVNAMKAHEVWRHTTTDIDFSPFPDVEGGTDQRDVAYTVQMMSTCRQLLQYRCGLQNNALSTDKLAVAQFTQMYDAMQKLGSPLIFQTAAKKRIGDPSQTLRAAVKYGANSVELPQGYPAWPASLLQETDRGLQKNPAR